MSRRLVAAVIAFGSAALVALIAQRRPAPGAQSSATAPPRAAAGSFDELIVERAGARTTISKQSHGQGRGQGDAYWVTAPLTYAADPGAAPAAFEAIEKLDASSVVTTRAARYAELGVELTGDDKARGIAVSVARAGGAGAHPTASARALLALVIGKTVGTGTMVRVRGANGADPVWQVNGDLRALFDKSTADWRDRSVTTFAVADAREIAIDARDGARIVLRTSAAGPAAGEASPHPRPASAPKWQVVQSSQEMAAIDDAVPNEIVSTMADLKASDFADGATPAASGLAPPRLTVTVTLQNGEKDLLLVGDDTTADEVFVKTPDSAQIFRVKHFNADRIARRPIQFGRKLLCDLPEAEIDAISVANGANSFALARAAGAWRATAPRSLVIDPEKVVAFPTIFRGWRAPRVAEAADERAPFGASVIEISGRTKSARCTVVAAPHPRERGAYLARALPGGGDTFVLPSWMIDRVAVRLDAIRAR
jgi:hypothetical protein